MSELRLETLAMSAAEVGPENPLPPLSGGRDIHVTEALIPGVSEEMLRNMAYGRVQTILPYTMQDRYTRDRAASFGWLCWRMRCFARPSCWKPGGVCGL